MSEQEPFSPAPGINVGDILYVIFRHKWKLLSICAVGLSAALALPFVMPPPYESEAKLFIKYVVEPKSASQAGANESEIKSADQQGETIINTEVEILTSLDLAKQVAATIGPEKILGKDGGTNINLAALAIRRNLLLEVPKKSSVIQVVFQHHDPAIVQPVLQEIIETYLKNHREIHRPTAVSDDVLTQETDQIRAQLEQTEDALRKAKAKAGVLSLEASQKLYADQVAKIRESMVAAEADLAECQASVAELSRIVPGHPTTGTNAVHATNEVAVSSQKTSEYKQICAVLDNLLKKQQELLVSFTPSNYLVRQVSQQIAAEQKLKDQMENDYPGLLSVKISDAKTGDVDPNAAARAQLTTEKAKVTALQSKIKALSDELDGLRKEASNMTDAESTITDLQRKKELQESHYKYFAEKLDNRRIDERLGEGRIPNISKIQEASPPFRLPTKLYKIMAIILFGSIGGAFGLVFLIEFFLDQSVRRPVEIENRLGLPLFISVPRVNLNGKARVLKPGRAPGLLPERTGVTGEPAAPRADAAPAGAEIAPWDPRHVLRPFYETLRDRLITFFEVNLMLHKPKLVAITSCSEGAGVSTVAAGLAASLSETGDGNVLLVEMNQKNGAAHQFYKGDLACGLDDALEMEKRDSALVQSNLYVVREGANKEKLPTAMPSRFKHLVPKLKASDYDYIIFDMPPVSQISVTPRLARFMDMVFMVVESEKTDRDVVKRASALLAESKANVGVILNKGCNYAPKLLAQDF
jgi:uncharacterized protein involved in exopolysaccharide biosynthesis/Mrp family chromosome partitioning ATPase